MKKTLYLLSLAITFLLILSGIIAFLFFRTEIQSTFFAKDGVQPGAIAPNESVAKCTAGDAKCESRNERIKANKLQGQSASFARHQCDGPRACPTPNPEQEATIQKAIKAFAKDEKLELIPLTGINVRGDTYYCAQDGTCWSYNTKSKQVAVMKDQKEEEPTTSPTPEEK